MALRPILKMGDARLLQRAMEVIRFGTPELIALAADMEDTMRALGGVGLAAPQVGVGLRVIVFGFDPASDPNSDPGECDSDADCIPFTVLINPALTPVSDETEEGWEGCLSIPGLRGLVPRRRHLRYEGFDLYGRRVGRMAEGFHARVVQHETDHLDGVLYPMRMRDMSRFGFTDVLFPNEKEPPDG